MAEVTTRMTHDEWLAEAVRRFGPDPMGWRFECPFCGLVSTPGDFLEAGVKKEDAHRASIECIGRVVGAKGRMSEKGETTPDGKPAQPCDWAAFGLFGNLGKGPVVVRTEGDVERETQAFPFAEPVRPAPPPPGPPDPPKPPTHRPVS